VFVIKNNAFLNTFYHSLCDGNAPYQEFGRCMKGGLIVIEGNCGHDTGLAMEGGEIHLNGDYHSLGVNKMGGKVFHKGKLIYPVNNDAS